MPLIITRRKRFDLNDGTNLLFYQAIDHSKRSKNENYVHCSSKGETIKFFGETHKEMPLELSTLIKKTLQVVILEDSVASVGVSSVTRNLS